MAKYTNAITAENNLFRTYTLEKSIVFHKTKEDFGGLSNMASGYPITINRIYIQTTEALYQACRFPHLPSVQREIIEQRSPMTAKIKSRQNYNSSRQDWNDIRYKVMRWCLRVKLAQNYDKFGQLLLKTQNLPIVELSHKDDYWGAKLANRNGVVLIGQNILGRLLMELREKLKEDSDGTLKTVPPLGIPDFLLLGESIDIVTERNSNDYHRSQYSLF